MSVITEIIDNFRQSRDPGKTTILPVERKQRTPFQARLRGLWDWFRLTVVMSVYITVLMVGGIFITKGMILLWGRVLGEYFKR